MTGANAPRHPRFFAFATSLALAVGALALAGPPSFEEDFNDNVVGGLWSAFNGDPTVMTVAEQNQRLEFPADGSAAGGACCLIVQSGVAGNGWVLDWSRDFRARIDFRINLPSDLPPNMPSAHVSLDFGFRTNGTTLVRGARFVFGAFITGPGSTFAPAIRLVRLAEGQTAIDTIDAPPPVTAGTLYLRYDAAADMLRVSFSSFTDPFAIGVANLRSEFGFSRTPVILRGVAQFADGMFRTSYGGENLHLDNFVIESGFILDTACPADIDDSGTVDVLDLLGVLTAWGLDDAVYDVAPAPQGDGIVEINDLLAVLGAWGGCP